MSGFAGRSYDGVAKTFHWLIVLLVLEQYVTKLVPSTVFGTTRGTLNYWHSAVGPAILLLMVLRLVWRLTHTPPPAPADLPSGLQILSRVTHWAFYALLVILPIMGWVALSGYGAHPTLLGLFPLPALAGKDKDLGAAWGQAHGILAWVLLAVIALHVAGALYHAVVKRDGVMQRMLPGTASP